MLFTGTICSLLSIIGLGRNGAKGVQQLEGESSNQNAASAHQRQSSLGDSEGLGPQNKAVGLQNDPCKKQSLVHAQ